MHGVGYNFVVKAFEAAKLKVRYEPLVILVIQGASVDIFVNIS